MKNSQLKDVFGTILSPVFVTVTAVVKLKGGFNCSIYRITDSKNRHYFAKHYSTGKSDTYDRAGVEFSSLMFLWKHGVRKIPKPIVLSQKNHIGIYGYLEGTNITHNTYTKNDIQTVHQFWKELHVLSKRSDAQKLSDAKDACFSVTDCFRIVETRLRKFLALPTTPSTGELCNFLVGEFIPSYKQAKEMVRLHAKSNQLNLKVPIKASCQTLSPSDFGFHNAFRTNRGIMFYDFEYFGRDDPAKMIADMYLHPRMKFPLRYREYFYTLVYNTLADKNLAVRLGYYYVVLSYQWSLIMLQVFIGSKKVSRNKGKILKRQLEKSRANLLRIRKELIDHTFPISLLP